MASQPEGPIDFDFSRNLGTRFNPTVVADQVVWPVVDDLWGGNWREDGEPGPSFRFPKSGTVDGKRLNVLAVASCYLTDPTDADSDIVDMAQLCIGEVAGGQWRQHFIEQARREKPGTYSKWGPADQWVVKSLSVYTFVGNGFTGHIRPRIENLNGKELWVPKPDTPDDKAQKVDMFQLADLETLETACEVLNAPVAVQHAIEKLKASSRDT